MAAVQFFLPYQTATYNGIAQSGAQLYFYTTGTTTPLTIYSNSGLSVARANPVVANGAGQFPAFYLDGTKTYRLVIKDKNGTSLGVDIDPYIPGTIPDAAVLQPYADSATASAAAAATSASGASTSASSASTSATNAATSATSAAGSATSAASSASAVSTSIASVPNATAHAATRSALAVLGSSSGPVYLRESGREGMFVWSSANNSTNVTNDSRQGVYVAPASDATGASGAWVRKFSGSTNVKWFGATADGVTDDSTAITGAIAFLKSIAGNPITTIYKASGKLSIPAGKYNCASTTIEITHTLIIEGEGGSGFGAGGGAATMLKWNDGVTGIRVQEYNTSGASTVDVSPFHFSASFTTLRGLYLYGGYSATESESHGIHTKTKIILEDVHVDNFSGDALYAHTSNGGGSPNEGNSNCSRAYNCHFRNSRNGLSITGGDANAWLFLGCFFDFNRSWGVNDTSFLGNTYIGCHQDSNGITTASGTFGASVVSQGGSRYAVVYGQEAGASTNAPKSSTVTITIASPGVVSWTAHGLAAGTPVTFSTTGALPTGLTAATTYYVVNPATDTFQVATSIGGSAINTSGSQSGVHTSGAALDNTYWYFTGAGAVAAPNIPTWVSGMTLRAGGPMLLSNANANSVVSGNYAEGGQGPIQQTAQGMVIGGSNNTNVKGGVWIRGFTGSYFRTTPQITVGNFQQYQRFGESFILDGSTDATSLTNPLLTIKTGNPTTGSGAIKYQKSDGTVMGQLTCIANFGLLADGLLGVFLRCGNVDTANTNSTGFNIASGKNLQYAGTAVLTSGVLTAAAFPAQTGDVTNSAGSLATTISANVVTDAKLRQGAALTVIGRSANSTGNVADIAGTNNTVLRVSGSVLGFGAVDISTAQVTGRLPAANMVQSAGLSVRGNSGTVTADVADMTGAADQVLRVNTGATALGFGTIATGGITAAAVTYAKIQNVAATALLGNPTGSPAAASEITLAGGLAFSGTTLTAAGALTPTSVVSSGGVSGTTISGSTSVLSTGTGGVGYAVGAGGTATQSTSKATAVSGTNKMCVDITLNAAALAASTTVSFTFTNTVIAATDNLIINHISVGTFGSYTFNGRCAAGSATIDVRNVSLGSLSEAIVIRVTVLKGANT